MVLPSQAANFKPNLSRLLCFFVSGSCLLCCRRAEAGAVLRELGLLQTLACRSAMQRECRIRRYRADLTLLCVL